MLKQECVAESGQWPRILLFLNHCRLVRLPALPLPACPYGPSRYLRQVAIADACSGLAAGLLAFEVRFGGDTTGAAAYFWLALSLPVLWLSTLMLAGAYDARFIGVGTDEFRRVLNTGICLTAAVAMVAYATKTDVARGYVVVSLPSVTAFDLLARYLLRKRLHHMRELGNCMRRVVVVGHPDVIGDLATVLRRDTYHGLSVVAACVLGPDCPKMIDGIPAVGGLGNVVNLVQRMGADTVAVLACPEMSGARLRILPGHWRSPERICAWRPRCWTSQVPRTTIRPTAGLPLLHMDHPEFSGSVA